MERSSREDFEKFANRILMILHPKSAGDFVLPKDDKQAASLVANTLNEINLLMYLQKSRLAKVVCQTHYGEVKCFSEFHRLWEKNHREILDLRIVDEKCHEVAERLESRYKPFSPSSIMERQGLTPQQIANARLFTAIQDFGFGLGTDYYKLAKEKPEMFSPTSILNNPQIINKMLETLGVSDYQTDKRVEWVQRCAKLLVHQYGGTAFNIAQRHGNDAVQIREALRDANLGIDTKKADMFLRDMQEFGIWKLKRFEEVSVAPDVNTMRIALRTGILHTRIPLLSSFMDVCCYQYASVSDEVNNAWRRVWELWRKIPDNHAVTSPAYIDFLVYNMGKKCCKSNKRRCEVPCTTEEKKKCYIHELALRDCNGLCMFKGICDKERRIMNPPKSISIFGRYGWTTSYSNEGGGLGLRC